MTARKNGSLACLVAVGLFMISGCSWSRFSDLKDESPVETFVGTDQIPGFAQQMSTVAVGDLTRLLVGGQPFNQSYAAAYDINSDKPSTDSYDLGYCGPDCVQSTLASMKTVALPDGTEHSSCFVFGAGRLDGTLGLLGRCGDGTKLRFDLPPKNVDLGFDVGPFIVTPALDKSDPKIREGFIAYESSHDDKPVLAASASSVQWVWVYPYGSTTPVELSRPKVIEDDAKKQPRSIDFGATIAVAALADGAHLVAVAAPMFGSLWLYKIDPSGKAENAGKPWGCLAGMTKEFGRFMFTGPLFDKNSEELFVSDDGKIRVFDANVLAAAPMGETCSVLFPEKALISSIVCNDTEATSGCGSTGAEFGRAIALGDLNGDGEKEVLVGVPSLTTPIGRAAGAVLVYRVRRSEAPAILETRYVTSAEEGDGLGYSVAALRVGNRDVIAAGSPGAGAFYVFYCSSLGGAGSSSSRCN